MERFIDTCLPPMIRRLAVTRPYLPSLDEFLPFLEQIWETRTLTNSGPFHVQFEAALAERLSVPFVSLFSSGETALLVALKALERTGEVITTPFSFPGTAHAIRWAGLAPVFADIEAGSPNLDVAAVHARISEKTAAILPVHCYGLPADIDGFAELATRTGIPVVYDAAHVMGAAFRGRSLAAPGDLAILSFHATKVLTTFEGGAVVTHTPQMKRRVDLLRNFGIADEETVELAGLNGKMSEFQAALGLLQLRHLDDAIARRRQIWQHYSDLLSLVEGVSIMTPPAGLEPNCGYVCVTFESGRDGRERAYRRLRDAGIHGRRYFSPLLTDLSMYRDSPGAADVPHARRLAERVLCLPIFPEMTDDDVALVVRTIETAG